MGGNPGARWLGFVPTHLILILNNISDYQFILFQFRKP
jgi:hypothetical protein